MAQRKTKKIKNDKKLFVLDTNILAHDPTAILRFQEHDVFIPAIVIEELDKLKTDYTIGRNAQQAIKFIAALFKQFDFDADIEEGVPLSLLSTVVIANSAQTVAPTGMLYLQTEEVSSSAGVFKKDTHDNEILSVALDLKNKKKNVVLVSNDINVRNKARILKIRYDQYKSDQTIEDIQLLYSGAEELPMNFSELLSAKPTSEKDGSKYYEITTPLAKNWKPCQFLYFEDSDGEEDEFMVLKTDGEKAFIRTIHNYRNHPVWGILARNREQNFALNALLDPDIDFVSLAGRAGSGKTLCTLASAIQQVLGDKIYLQIIYTRETSPIGKDIGLLPGTEEAKMMPWLGALFDNIEILDENCEKTKGVPSVDKALQVRKPGDILTANKISIKSLNFFQGRTLIRRFLIIDEAQNLTAKQAKELITRAGPGTKIVFLGNLAQVVTKYLPETSSGLAYIVDRFKICEFGAHVTLIGVERSRLAEFAANNL